MPGFDPASSVVKYRNAPELKVSRFRVFSNAMPKLGTT